MGHARHFLEFISHTCAKWYVGKENIMSNLWLLALPFGGFVWYVLGGIMRIVPKSNDDFTFF